MRSWTYESLNFVKSLGKKVSDVTGDPLDSYLFQRLYRHYNLFSEKNEFLSLELLNLTLTVEQVYRALCCVLRCYHSTRSDPIRLNLTRLTSRVQLSRIVRVITANRAL